MTQFFGAFTDNTFKSAILIWITYDAAEKSGGNADFMVTIAAGIFILPFFLFSATAGQLADKFERSQLTRRIKLVEILLMVIAAGCFIFQSVYGLLIVLFCMGGQSAFFGPIKYSLLPDHLDQHELVGGNALIEAGTFLSILLGTIYGAVIVRTQHGLETVAISVIVLAIIGWIASRYIPKARRNDPNLVIQRNVLTATNEVLRSASADRLVWISIMGISWFWFVGATFLTQIPLYTLNVVSANENVVTFFLTLFSVGIAGGSMFCNYQLKGKITGRLIPYGLVGIAASVVLFYFFSVIYSLALHDYILANTGLETRLFGLKEFLLLSPACYGIVASLFLFSACAGLYVVPLYTILQHRSDKNRVSRTIASNNIVNAFFMVISSLVALALYASGLEVEHILLVVGLACPGLLLVLGPAIRYEDNRSETR